MNIMHIWRKETQLCKTEYYIQASITSICLLLYIQYYALFFESHAVMLNIIHTNKLLLLPFPCRGIYIHNCLFPTPLNHNIALNILKY